MSYNCYQLKEIILNENLKTIGKCAFEKCSNLEIIEIQNSGGISKLEEIDSNSFENCYNLKYICNSDKIRKNILENIKSLFNKNIKYLYCSKNEKFESINFKNVDDYLKLHLDDYGTLWILPTVKTIESNIFENNQDIKVVNFIDGKDRINIKKNAFANCNNLIKICLNENNSINKLNLFFSNKNVEQFVIPKSVKKINNGIFSSSKNINSIVFLENNQLIELIMKFSIILILKKFRVENF